MISDAQTALAGLSPRGVWTPPLTPDQTQSAMSLGRTFYATEEGLANDPYDLQIPSLKLFITVATVFSRLAAYAGQCARTGEQTNMAAIESVIYQTSLSDSFMMRILSRNRIVSVVHLGYSGHQNMSNVERRKEGKTWIETCTFPYPRDLASPQFFEAFVPGPLLITGKKETISVPFDKLH